MTITPVATGAPTDVRQSVEQNTYELLQQLNIPVTVQSNGG